MKEYNQEFILTFRDVDVTHGLTIPTLVDFMQEVACNHATELGVNYSALEDDYYWIIMRTKVQLEKVPVIGERIRIQTFIEGRDRLYSVRRFNIYNEANEFLGHILGYYLLMGKENHRPVKLKTFAGKESLFENVYMGDKVAKLNSEIVDVVRKAKRTAYSSDIDSNSHMNNAHYIRWIVDMFTMEELSQKRIEGLQIQYVKEIREGEEIEVVRGLDAEGMMCVMGKDEDENLRFVSRIC